MANQNERHNDEAPQAVEITDLFDEEGNLLPAPEETITNAEPVEPPADEEDDLPNKYKGKSLREVVEMHQAAESLVGRHSSELGELRRAVDELVKTQLESNITEEPVDFFADPQAAVADAIAKDPTVKAAADLVDKATRTDAQAQLRKKHPEMDDLLASEEFGQWVSKSALRTRLIKRAHNEFDLDAADELFSLYKEHARNVSNAVNADAAARTADAKRASTGGQRGGAPTRGKPVYSRRQIINLMRDNPKEYARRSAEFRDAYAEGRVRA